MFRNHDPVRPALCALLLTTAAPAFAQDDAVLIGPEPDWVIELEPLAVPDNARGMVFFRRQQTELHLTSEGQFSYVLNHVRLLHPNALQLGNIGITWNPAAGAPTVHRLRIHRDGEIIDVLESNAFEILRREDQLEAARLDGLLTATLQVPDLRVGDDLEIAYTTPTANPTLPDRDFGMLFLNPDPSPGRIQLRLSWEDTADAPSTRMSGDLADFAVIGDNAITINVDNAPALNPPRDAPPRYQFQRVLEFTDFENWRTVSARFDGLFDTARTLRSDSPVANEAARIARNHTTEMARARAALDLVTQQVRYIYVGLNTGALTPATADETWERRYGDCKGKTALLLALLDELGIESEAVVVNNSGLDDGLNQLLPSPGLFDHVLVRATIDGEEYWMDGTLPGIAIPTSSPVLPYRWVLPLRDGGTEIEQLAWERMTAPDEMVVYNIDASAGFDTSAQITQTTIARGPSAIGEYFSLSALTDQQLENAFRNRLAGSTSWDTVDDVTWTFDREQQASVLVITGTGRPDWEANGIAGQELILPGGGFNPPQRRQRDAGQDQTAPYRNDDGWSCHVTSVRIPESTDPEQWHYNSTFDTQMYGRVYRRMFSKRDRTIRMIRLSRIELLEITPELAENDNGRLANFDNSMARIEYDPRYDNNFPDQIDVPAADEMDWLTDQSACDPDFGYD